MTEYIITRASIINDCLTDGAYHLMFTENQKPCEEAYLKVIIDNDGEVCSRYFIQLENSIDALDRLGEKYDMDVIVTKNTDFDKYIALVLLDEEIIRED